jgi:hypothetical protein
MWRRLDVPLQLALCDIEAALNLPAKESEARKAADEARTILETLGAPTLIDRLDSRRGVEATTGSRG